MLRTSLLAGLMLCATVVQTSSQAPRLNLVMREKLQASQALLGALVTSRWSELERQALVLQRVTRAPGWAVLTEPEYRRQTAAYITALDALVEAARHRDLEAAPQAYVSVTMSCVQCHRYVAGRRIAGGRQEPVHD